ncbi:Type 1 glutamine amidotransferase-like domain-containing protein [Agromyces sp. ZXT2-6]|uniref:Type 1 glutamine amidotransferase-like domain-containing protein n=1 Tax=Agromyces sp. ZXT2-6 TaxID=3461153 RepID=UPI004054D55D
MSVHLVGGGWTPQHAEAVYGPFLGEAGEAASRDGADRPRVAVLVVAPPGSGADERARWTAALEAASPADAPADVMVTIVGEDGEFAASAVAGAHGVLVGGGLTPAYRSAVEPVAGELRRLVASGLPYLGFSAGAAIAADTALLGGWRIGGVPVAPEEAAEDLDDVTVEAGIGLVDLTIDCHAAQWGTLTRLIAATEAGLVDGGIAIDEDTLFSIGAAGLRVAGAGSVWSVTAGDDGVVVRSITG